MQRLIFIMEFPQYATVCESVKRQRNCEVILSLLDLNALFLPLRWVYPLLTPGRWMMLHASILNVLSHNFNNIDLICHVSTWFYNIYIVSYYLTWWSCSGSIIFSQGPEKSPFKWLTGFLIRPWHLPDTKVLLGSTDIIFGAFYVFLKLRGASLNGT